MEEENYVKKMKGLSKALSIISKILKVLVIIGACGIILCMVVLPMLFKKVDITDNEIKINEQSILSVEKDEEKVSLKVFDKVVVLDTDVVEYEEILKVFNEKSKGYVLTYSETLLFISLVCIVILYMCLIYIDKLFTNIVKKDSPFELENALYLRKCGYYTIALIVAPLILSGLYEMISGTNMIFNWNFVEILLVLVIFTMSYVFEYGYYLENKKSKTK